MYALRMRLKRCSSLAVLVMLMCSNLDILSSAYLRIVAGIITLELGLMGGIVCVGIAVEGVWLAWGS